MARNRKRAKERRARRPAASGGPLATARNQLDDSPPNPIAHATPDAELAEAQVALGRPELIADSAGELSAEVEAELEYDEDEDRAADELQELGGDAGGGGPRRGSRDTGRGGGGGGTEAPGAAVPAPRQQPGNRLANFLQGSWRELQRVQWPDRRQVMQATGVVIGFVVVAGVFLGVADFVAGKLVTFILK
ncbi:MAG: preprotein translocase subunit SecE [Solirubrobacteraceae bacterium]